MKNDTVLQRILYAGIGLVIIVILILTFLVIPAVLKDRSPQADTGRAVPGIMFIILIHLGIVAALLRTIIINNRGGSIEKGLLIGLGIVLLLLGLMVLDGASAYSDHTDPIMKRASILMFSCTGCNLVAGILCFLVAWHSKRLIKTNKR